MAKKNLKLKEEAEVSCAVLADILSTEVNSNVRRLIMMDFINKSQSLLKNEVLYLAYQCILPVVPEEERKFISKFMQQHQKETKPKADILIVSIIQEELESALTAFDIEYGSNEHRYAGGLRFWETKIFNKSLDRDLSVVITMIGEARNVECAATCSKIFNIYDVETAFLSGIAAGLESKVKLGDVVVAEEVIDYEGGRVEPDGIKKRPKSYSPSPEIKRDLSHYNPEKRGWRDLLKRCLNKADVQINSSEWQPEYHSGVILSGEKLIGDGSIGDKREQLHEKTRALDMESSGFARICEETGIPWFVFRGISDYGDPEKGKTAQWRLPSALAASTAIRAFIESDYRKKISKF